MQDEVTLEINVVMGEVKLYVPNNLEIKFIGTPIMGNVDDRTNQVYSVTETQKKLILRYEVVMGSIKIKNI